MEINFEHTRVFYEISKSRQYRYVINEGGTRSSKTWSLLSYFLILCLSNPNKKLTIYIYRKELVNCRNTVMTDFIEMLERFDLIGNKSLVDYNKTKSKFTINGNSIEFRGADNPQKLRGAKRRYVWLNEANEFTWEDFKQLNIRTIRQVYLDYNPSFTDSWIYELITNESGLSSDEIMKYLETADNKVFRSGNVSLIQSTYKDNTKLEASIIEAIESLKKYNDDDYNVYALGIRSNPYGLMLKRNFHQVYNQLPERKIGVIYCDPNLSLKGKGDTTAIVKMYYSPLDGYFYIDNVVCRSFKNSNDLLDAVLSMYGGDCRFIAFDGNFAQESSWTNHVQNYSVQKGLPFPLIEYKRYRVDDTAKTTQYLWNDRQIFFNPNLENTDDGKRFMSQVYQFNGKKNTAKGNQDDAPDALICAINYMYDLNIVASKGAINVLNNIVRK